MTISKIPAFKPSSDLLKGKTILVTGAGDGIGATAAKSFACHGATVIIAGRTVAKLEQVYDAIVAAGNPEPTIFPIDLEGATDSDYATLADAIAEQFGMLDGLLHNAALLGQRAPLANASTAVWEQVLKVNVTAEFMMTKALLPVLEKAPSSSVVFTSSGVGRKGRAFWGAYAVSKFAVEGLCQVLADEFDGTCNIRANCINPGATRTRMRAAAYPAEDPGTLKTAQDLMPAYLYLISDASREHNGQSFDV